MKPKSATRKKTTPKKTPKKNVGQKAIKPSSDAVKQTKIIKTPPQKAKTVKPVERTRKEAVKPKEEKTPAKKVPAVRAKTSLHRVSGKGEIPTEKIDLSDKHNLFVKAFIASHFNGTEASQQIYGGSRKVASVRATRLLGNDNIRQEIRRQLQVVADELEINPRRVLQEMAKMAYADMGDYMTINEDGSAFIDLTGIKGNKNKTVAIQEMTSETYLEGKGENAVPVKKVKLKLADKAKNLQMLGQYLKIFSDSSPAPESFITDILSQVKDGEMTARDAAYEIQMKGLPLPEILKIELSKSTDAPEDENNKPITVEELERKAREALEEATRQRDHFVPQRQAEVKEIKDRLKGHDSFMEE